MPNPDVVVDALYVHPSGLIVRVLDQHVPGDRDDELRVWCEVVQASPKLRYKVGERDGWNLLPFEGWSKVTTIVHGWRPDTEKLRVRARNERSFAAYLKAVSHTVCGKPIYGKEPCAVGGPEWVTCKKCKQKGGAA